MIRSLLSTFISWIKMTDLWSLKVNSEEVFWTPKNGLLYSKIILLTMAIKVFLSRLLLPTLVQKHLIVLLLISCHNCSLWHSLAPLWIEFSWYLSKDHWLYKDKKSITSDSPYNYSLLVWMIITHIHVGSKLSYYATRMSLFPYKAFSKTRNKSQH